MLVLLLILVVMSTTINCQKTIAEDNGDNELELILLLIKHTSEKYLSSIQSIVRLLEKIMNSQRELYDAQTTLNDWQKSQALTLDKIAKDIESIKYRLERMEKRIIAVEIRLKQKLP
jgi:hypothetical protein